MPASDHQINRLAFQDHQHLRQQLLIVLHVGIHDGDIGRGRRQGAFDASRREAPRPIRCRQ
jgi:hypothetical protein